MGHFRDQLLLFWNFTVENGHFFEFCSIYFMYTFYFCPVAVTWQYELTVVASDSLFETETRVVVHIRDVNDLPPVFDRGTYVANTVEEYAQPDRRILKVGLRCLNRLWTEWQKMGGGGIFWWPSDTASPSMKHLCFILNFRFDFLSYYKKASFGHFYADLNLRVGNQPNFFRNVQKEDLLYSFLVCRMLVR